MQEKDEGSRGKRSKVTGQGSKGRRQKRVWGDVKGNVSGVKEKEADGGLG